MKIWVDADACPNPIKEVLFRASNRLNVTLTLVANHFVKAPNAPQIRSIQVPTGFDVADDRISESIEPFDLVITADIPLAAEIVARGGTALNPRGTLYDKDNVRAHLVRRNAMEERRASGELLGGGPPALRKADVQTFANALDRYLAKHCRPPSDGPG